MKAVRCHAYGPVEDLTIEDVPSLQPTRNQVVVTVKAAGVNFPDMLIVEGKYQARPDLPFTPGIEFAGIVKSVGHGVTQVHPGDAVMGNAVSGAFAEEAMTDVARVVRLPANADLTVAAALQIAHGTALHALVDRARLAPHEILLILGAGGGAGLAALQIGKLLGAKVIAAASTAAKLEICRLHGAEFRVNYNDEDLRERVRAITDGRGVDVIFDPVGGSYSAQAMRCVAWNGRYLVIGFAAGDIPRVALNLPLLKGFSIDGVFWGEFVRRQPEANAANVQRLMQWVAGGKLHPVISARYPLSGAVAALNALKRRAVVGKVVIVP